MCVAFMNQPLLSFPLVFVAVAGGFTPPTNLLSGGEKYEESCRVPYFCRALCSCFRFVTDTQPSQE
jgi:hypothetical protein